MKYWIVKGTQRSARNIFSKILVPGDSDVWTTRKLPKHWSSGDRVFIWESSPGLRLVGLAELEDEDNGEENGNQTFVLKYLTAPLHDQPTIAELRKIPALRNASFLKSGPATTVLSLTVDEAYALFEIATQRNRYLLQIWPDLSKSVNQPIPELDEFISGNEGNQKLATHLRRERNQTLVKLKKDAVLSKMGIISCEVCDFIFSEHYGSRGHGFCEVHHRTPLAYALEEVTTELCDLAVVCSNCHRMLHIKPWITIEELRDENVGRRPDTTLKYRNYRGSVVYSADDRLLHGRIMGIRDSVTYDGLDVESIERNFHGAVDESSVFVKPPAKIPALRHFLTPRPQIS